MYLFHIDAGMQGKKKIVYMYDIFTDQILLFLTGGENIKGSPLETIRDENEALQNRVVIHTFGIGTGKSYMQTLHMSAGNGRRVNAKKTQKKQIVKTILSKDGHRLMIF